MNPVGWFEIYVDDIEKAKSFYQDVFQVKLETLTNPGIESTSGLEMWGFPGNNEYGATGAIATMPGISPGGTGTLVYFSCEDCKTEEARVTEFGGKVLKPKCSIGEHGFISMCMDTAGNMICLLYTSPSPRDRG